MERANIIQYLASSADSLISSASEAHADTATDYLREAAELLALGSALLQKNQTIKLPELLKEAA